MALKVRVQTLPWPLTPVDVGRARGGDGDEAVAFVAMDEGDGLAVAAEEVAGVDVDELEHRGIELHLQRHGEDVAAVGRA